MLRKPLVIIDGAICELPASDSTATIAIESAVVTLPDQVMSHEVVVNRVGTLPSQQILVWLGATVDADDNDLWQLEGVMVSGICQTDAILLVFDFRYPESGSIKINYQVM